MEKQKIIFVKEDEYTEFEYNKQTIKVLRYIPLAVRYILTDSYANAIFDKSIRIGERYIQAENQIMLGIVDLCTNIDIDHDEFDIDEFIASGIYELITDRIQNYLSFMDDLYGFMSYAMKQYSGENTVSYKINELVDSVTSFLDRIGEVDLSVDGVAGLVSGILEAQKGFEDKYQINPPELDFVSAVAEATPSKPKSKKKAK